MYFLFILGEISSVSVYAQKEHTKPLKVYIRDSLYYTQAIKDLLPRTIKTQTKNKQDSVEKSLRKIEWIPISRSILYTRLKLEGLKTQADIVIGLESDIINELDASPLPSHLFESLSLPQPWHNNRFLPLYYGYITLIYNEKLIHNPSLSFEKLITTSTQEKIIFPNPRTSIVGYGFACWLANYVQKDASISSKSKTSFTLKEKIVTMPTSWDIAYTLFRQGESNISVAYTTSLLYHRQKGEDWFKIIPFPEGHPLQIYVAFKTLKAAHDKDADHLLDLLTSIEFQKTMALELYMYPVRKEAFSKDLSHLPIPQKVIEHTLSRQDVLKMWQEIMII